MSTTEAQINELNRKTNKLFELIEKIQENHNNLIRNYDNMITSFAFLEKSLKDISNTLVEIKDLQQQQITTAANVIAIKEEVKRLDRDIEKIKDETSDGFKSIREEFNEEISERDRLFIRLSIGGLSALLLSVLAYLLNRN